MIHNFNGPILRKKSENPVVDRRTDHRVFVKTGMMFGEYYPRTTATPRRDGHRGVEVRQAGVTGIFYDSSNAFSVFGIVTVSTPFL
jgi:hypothetical protein